MHLAIVSPYPPHITGIGQYGFHISRILAQSGLFTRLTVLTHQSATDNQFDSINSIEVKNTWRSNSVTSGFLIASELKHLQPDLVWFNLGASAFGRSPYANLSGFLSPWLSQRLDIPTVLTLHELIELADLRALKSPGGRLAPLGARLLTRLALQSDVICLTMRHYVHWVTQHYNHKKYVHIPIGAYYPPEILPEQPTRELLFFTTLAPFKGLEVLLDAFQVLQQDDHQLRLTIAGASHARFPEYALKLHQTYKHFNGVRWLGQVPEEEVRTLFAQAQIVVLPYTASTGSSSVLYQAAMWGRPIVASDLAETHALATEHNLQMSFFKNGNVASLVAALKSMLASSDLRRGQVEHNFRVIQHNRPEQTCYAYIRAFNAALALHSVSKRLSVPTATRSEGL